MTEEELDKRLREIHISGIRYGKTITEAFQITIRVEKGGYTPKHPLKIIEIIRNESYRKQAEYHISRLKESIKEIHPYTAERILKSIEFEIKPMKKMKRKPLEWALIEDYVDVLRESEVKPNDNSRDIK